MMKITQKLLLQVLEQNPIAEYFRHCQLFQQHGKIYTCCCPFHSEKTPSCMIDPEFSFFYCHGCGIGGDVITFTQITQKLSYEEAFAVLAEKIQNPEYCNPVPSQNFIRNRCYAINRETANFYYWNLLHGNDRRGLQYFGERQLSAGIVKKYGLGFAPDDWHQLRDFLRSKGFSDEELLLSGVCRRSAKHPEILYDNFRNRVTFPILNTAGQIIGFGGRVLDDSKPKYLNTSETPVFDKSNNLFSLHFAQHVSSEMLILAEGYMDVIAMHQAGFENVVATLGTAITGQQARLIARYTKQVIIAYDSDTAGQNATEKAIRHFEAVGLQARILRMENAKDPDEFLKKYGREKFRALLEHAQDVISFRIHRCRNDLDLQTERGKTIFLRRCVPILANISNAIQRKNHVFRIAEALEIDPGILDKQVIRTIRKEARISLKTIFQEIEKNFYIQNQKQNQNYKNYADLRRQHPQKSKSEELLLACCMRFPEQAETIFQALPPESFTDFHRKIYQAVRLSIRGHDENLKFMPSFLFSETDFAIQEISAVAGILAHYREMIFTPEVIQDCIANLQNADTCPVNALAMSDHDLQQIIINQQKHIHWINE